jgi:ABC-type cobalamin/Fe3+-siderophores transport system ATPase subunit
MHEGEVVCQGTSDEVYDSGCLQKAFDVEIERIQTKTGWHYICDSELYKR